MRIGKAGPAVAGLFLESRMPDGRYWSCDSLRTSTRELCDPDNLLGTGDLISVHPARGRRFLLRVAGREGERVHLEWAGRP